MKENFTKHYNTIKKSFEKLIYDSKYYFKHNILFLTFVLTSLLISTLLRFLTIKNFTAISPFLADFAIIMFIGAIGVLFKPKNRFVYYFTWTIIFTVLCIINSAYYSNYVSFTSFSLLATSVQIFGVSEALNTIIELKDFSYIIAPIIMIAVHKYYKNTSFYDSVKGKKSSKVTFLKISITGIIALVFFISTLSGTDISRLYKQWNREYVVMKFGIYIYQGNDLISSLRPQISPLFGYDKAAKNVRDYYEEYPVEISNNEYTNKYENKNVIVIHAESIQKFLLNNKINGKEITPNLNNLSKEGMYFSNFYSQESVGTSSDSEFTFATSLLPATNGTVFVSYWDREYISIQNLLKEQGYYTYSMHANKGNFWNRDAMHKKLGYDKFYNYTSAYKIEEENIIGLGLNDKEFFKQSIEIMKKIDSKYDKWYSLSIMLTNHTPFAGLEDFSDLDLTYKTTTINEDTGLEHEVVNDYLSNKLLGQYLKAANYADQAIGEFMDGLEEAGLLDDSIVVIYGDHDAKIKRSEYDYYYNYDPTTDKKLSKEDPKYKEFTKHDYEINRSVPFIIWTKDKPKKEIKKVMGMYDVLPTLGNMLGISSSYSLGHDIFSIDENFVVFPNGNWITNKMYYDSQSDEGILLDEKAVISADYIEHYKTRAEREVVVSNDIIVHDLIKKIRESTKVIKGE